MKCSECQHWHVGTWHVYSEGTRIFEPTVEGSGLCRCPGVLKDKATPPDFGCLNFEAGTQDDQKPETIYGNPPWEIWTMIPCPAHKLADGQCICAGTGYVRRYADGTVVDEHTRVHPHVKLLQNEALRAELLAKAKAELERLTSPEPATTLNPENSGNLF